MRSPLCACCVGEVLVKSQPSLSTRGFTEGINLTCAGTVAKTLGRNHTSGHLQVRSLLFTGSVGAGLVTRQSSTHTRGHTQERRLMSASCGQGFSRPSLAISVFSWLVQIFVFLSSLYNFKPVHFQIVDCHGNAPS